MPILNNVVIVFCDTPVKEQVLTIWGANKVECPEQ